MISAMGRAARAKVLERHDIDKEASKLIELFRRPPNEAKQVAISEEK
jgi:hypothetical protein